MALAERIRQARKNFFESLGRKWRNRVDRQARLQLAAEARKTPVEQLLAQELHQANNALFQHVLRLELIGRNEPRLTAARAFLRLAQIARDDPRLTAATLAKYGLRNSGEFERLKKKLLKQAVGRTLGFFRSKRQAAAENYLRMLWNEERKTIEQKAGGLLQVAKDNPVAAKLSPKLLLEIARAHAAGGQVEISRVKGRLSIKGVSEYAGPAAAQELLKAMNAVQLKAAVEGKAVSEAILSQFTKVHAAGGWFAVEKEGNVLHVRYQAPGGQLKKLEYNLRSQNQQEQAIAAELAKFAQLEETVTAQDLGFADHLPKLQEFIQRKHGVNVVAKPIVSAQEIASYRRRLAAEAAAA